MISRLFSRKRPKEHGEAPPPVLHTDLHSHLIPGIDDGAKSMEQSLQMLRSLHDLGYRRIITTPHVMADTYRNTTEQILDGLDALRQAAQKEEIDIAIDAAAEYYMDEALLQRLHNDDILTIGGEYLLFETSYVSKPLNFDEIIYEIQARGYTPLFAHPERYRYIKNPKEEFRTLKEKGVHLQLDLNSLGGYYGRQAREHALILSREGLLDFLGSDVHHDKQVTFLEKVFASREYRELWYANHIRNDLLT